MGRAYAYGWFPHWAGRVLDDRGFDGRRLGDLARHLAQARGELGIVGLVRLGLVELDEGRGVCLLPHTSVTPHLLLRGTVAALFS